VTAGFDPALLHRRWVHAHEEDTEREMVFRPAEVELPPSRGRAAFELKDDGTFAESGIGPTDRPEPGGGRWRLGDDGTIELGVGAGGGVPRTMRIVSVDDDRLVVERGGVGGPGSLL
jgi:hypothetical protein